MQRCTIRFKTISRQHDNTITTIQYNTITAAMSLGNDHSKRSDVMNITKNQFRVSRILSYKYKTIKRVLCSQIMEQTSRTSVQAGGCKHLTIKVCNVGGDLIQ